MNLLNQDITIIVFSKDRPLQLQGYIESLIYFSGVKSSSISVLYKATGIDYSNLINNFSEVNWIAEKSFFDDLNELVIHANSYIIFGCDDVLFKDYFDFSYPLNLLENNDDIFGFSLRLGKNLKSYTSEIESNGEHLQWEWTDINIPNWNYPWELDATIYRKVDVLQIINKLSSEKVKNPNFLEGLIAETPSIFIERNMLASFFESKCIVLTINRVQYDYKNDFDDIFDTSIETLNNFFTKGYRLDFISIRKKKNRYIHVGAEFFKLQGENNRWINNINSVKLFLRRNLMFSWRLLCKLKMKLSRILKQ